MRVRVTDLILSVLTVLAVSVPVLALGLPSASNITVRPFLQEVKINQDEASKTFELTISNDSKFSQVFHLSVVNFGSLNETGGLVFEGANVKKLAGKYGLANWLKLDKSEIQLNANQQAVIKATINNDASLAPGAHYAAVITSASKPIEKVLQLTVTPKVSSLIFATKTGGEFYDIHLSSVSHNGNLWNLPAVVQLRFKSTGNTYIIPRGIVSLKQGDKILARGVINQQSSIVLPETVREFEVPLVKAASVNKGLIKTSYEIQTDYRYDGISRFAAQTNKYSAFNKTAAVLLVIVVVSAIVSWRLILRTGIGKLGLTKKKK